MSASGIIFSNIHDNHIPELTRMRTIASVPFACRYRFIDFTLSNMVNSNIYNINVIAQYNYQSLMDHIGSGKDWDLARRAGGIKILPPYIAAFENGTNQYQTRLESLKSVASAIMRLKDEYVVLSDCDVICNIDLNDMIKYHRETGADMTFAVKRVKLDRATAKQNVIFNSNEDGRLTEVVTYPDYEGEADITLNIMVMKTSDLQSIVAEAITHNRTSLTKDYISRGLGIRKYMVYRYDGYFACISSLADYYRCSMELLTDPASVDDLFNVPNRPVYTKVRNSTPAYYSDSARVRDSLIADGAYIEGTVENSIVFRGVHIGKNATVKNSIVMQDTIISQGAFLNYVITDKNAVIRDGRMLCGADVQPYYVPKGKMI